MIKIKNIDGDDPSFILNIESIVTNTIEKYQPGFLRIVRIDNWFGKKWRSFSGKIMGAVGISKNRLTIPPFVPSRVVDESCLEKTIENDYKKHNNPYILHQSFSSDGNTRRYFDSCCPDTVAIWFSSSSKDNGRGAVMVYISSPGNEAFSWYAELINNVNWAPSVLSGISKDEFKDLVKIEQHRAEQQHLQGPGDKTPPGL